MSQDAESQRKIAQLEQQLNELKSQTMKIQKDKLHALSTGLDYKESPRDDN